MSIYLKPGQTARFPSQSGAVILAAMKIATWNINSIKVRLPLVLRWLEETRPDILMLQELKGLEFPADAFAGLGYRAAVNAQKTWNGVAILSKTPVTTVLERLPGDETDEQARYLEVEAGALRLINIYLPNGNPVESEKYPYKLRWMDRLRERITALRQGDIPFLIGGDFNVIPEDRDCYDPAAWAGDALFRSETRRKFRALLNLGLTDAFRVFDQYPRRYTFWDYQAGAFQNDNGIRIDHFLLSPALADRLSGCVIDRTPRGWDTPSDHTPVIAEIA